MTNRFCLLFCTDISLNQVRSVAHHKETSPQISGCEPELAPALGWWPRGVRSQQLLPEVEQDTEVTLQGDRDTLSPCKLRKCLQGLICGDLVLGLAVLGKGCAR